VDLKHVKGYRLEISQVHHPSSLFFLILMVLLYTSSWCYIILYIYSIVFLDVIIQLAYVKWEVWINRRMMKFAQISHRLVFYWVLFIFFDQMKNDNCEAEGMSDLKFKARR